MLPASVFADPALAPAVNSDALNDVNGRPRGHDILNRVDAGSNKTTSGVVVVIVTSEVVRYSFKY